MQKNCTYYLEEIQCSTELQQNRSLPILLFCKALNNVVLGNNM